MVPETTALSPELRVHDFYILVIIPHFYSLVNPLEQILWHTLAQNLHLTVDFQGIPLFFQQKTSDIPHFLLFSLLFYRISACRFLS